MVEAAGIQMNEDSKREAQTLPINDDRETAAARAIVLELSDGHQAPSERSELSSVTPRASLEGTTMSLFNGSEENSFATVDLDDEQAMAAERDRMVELRVKFSVEGMHGVLTNKTKNVRDGPNAKKLAEPRWKTILPL